MVELTIVLPLLMLILFAVIEFGMALQRWQMLSNAAREGARAGVVYACDRNTVETQVRAHIRDYMAAVGIGPGEYTIDDNGNLCGPTGTDAVVTITHNFPFPVLSSLVPGLESGITLRGTSVMRNE